MATRLPPVWQNGGWDDPKETAPMKDPITMTIQRLRLTDKVKDLQTTLRKLKASLQSIKPKDPRP